MDEYALSDAPPQPVASLMGLSWERCLRFRLAAQDVCVFWGLHTGSVVRLRPLIASAMAGEVLVNVAD